MSEDDGPPMAAATQSGSSISASRGRSMVVLTQHPAPRRARRDDPIALLIE
jgi:hypothetical protein